MKERYLPLVIASDAEDGADYMEQLRSCFGVGLGADMEAFADFIISDNFCRREYDGEFNIQRNSGMPLPQMIENRKPPRPHVRCAHWQRYHVGAGRKEIRINWIPPTFVCGKQSIDVTITPIMKDELDH